MFVLVVEKTAPDDMGKFAEREFLDLGTSW